VRIGDGRGHAWRNPPTAVGIPGRAYSPLVADRKRDYTDVSVYPVGDELRDALFAAQTECAVVWSTSDGWPVGVLHRYVWHEGRFWVSTMAHRKRVPALRARPKSTVIVSGENVRPGWRDFTVTVKTLATVHEGDPEVTRWFFPALASRLTGGDAARAAAFVERLDTPGRVVIELDPQAWITYDGAKVAAHVAGRWQPGDTWPDPRLSPAPST